MHIKNRTVPLKRYYKRRSVLNYVKKLISVTLLSLILFIVLNGLRARRKEIVEEGVSFSKFIWMAIETIENLDVPVVVWWTGESPGSSKSEIICKENNIKCIVMSRKYEFQENAEGAYLFYGSKVNFDDMPSRKGKNNVIWGLFHEKGPRDAPILMHRAALRLFNYSATFSRYSDVPFPLQHLKSKEDITTRKYYKQVSVKNSWLPLLSPILYLQSDCTTFTERDEYVRELMDYISIDSYGDCVKNKKKSRIFTKNNFDDDDVLNFTALYKFVIAIEDAECDDYITGVLWRAIKTGVVPIYFGSPTINDWLPNEKSAILLTDHLRPEFMKEHLTKLMANDSLYEEYLKHKTEQIITNKNLLDSIELNANQSDIVGMKQKFECMICDILHGNRAVSRVSQILPSHYNCPVPVSALSMTIDPQSKWIKLYNKNRDVVKQMK